MKNANLSRTLTPDRMISSPSIREISPKVLIYADGSCLKNGSDQAQAGAGVVIMTEDQKRIKLKACYLGRLTNQKAEILACAVGFESLKVPCRVRIFTDSKYVVETMKGLNRMKSNREFWNRLVTSCLTHQIEWNWIRGHAGEAFQETADKLSRAAAFAKDNLDKNTLDRLALMLLNKPDEDTVKMIRWWIKNFSGDLRRSEKSRRSWLQQVRQPIRTPLCGKVSSQYFGGTYCSKFADKISRTNR